MPHQDLRRFAQRCGSSSGNLFQSAIVPNPTCAALPKDVVQALATFFRAFETWPEVDYHALPRATSYAERSKQHSPWR